MRLDLAHVSTASWVAFWFLVFVGGIAGFGAYLWVLRAAPTSLVSTYAYVNPVVAVFLGWWLLGERFDWHVWAAAAIILLGVVLIVSSNNRVPPS